jgi:pimeloyl-ACP methyl ester carboxylesterase
MRFVYLHGFASSPGSRKARFFAERFQELGISLELPDLAEENFRNLTLTAQLNVIARASRDEPVSLIGSSMGGYLAALYAARHPLSNIAHNAAGRGDLVPEASASRAVRSGVEKLVLLAPAFSFASRWPETLGEPTMEQWKRTNTLKVFHYSEGREVELGYQLVEDARQYEAYPDVSQPVLIFQGRNDTVVPPEYAVRFADQHPNARLRLLNSDHELTNVLDDMWMETEKFLFSGKLDPIVD